MEKIRLMVILYREDPADPAFALLRGIFPICQQCSEPGLTVLQPAPGVVIQLMTAGAQPPAFVAAGAPLLSYGVEALQTAVNAALARGAVVLQDAATVDMGYAFAYLQFPGERPFGLFSVECEATAPIILQK